MAHLNHSQKKQIGNLLFVFLGGIVCAILLAASMLWNYGPSGRYIVKNALLSPETAEKMSYIEPRLGPKNSTKYVFDKFQFTNWDPGNSELNKIIIPPVTYKKLFELISSEKSENVPNEIVAQFNPKTANLTIWIRPENESKEDKAKIFQQIQFLGNYYRIELRTQDPDKKWIYFYHPHINQEVYNILVKQQ